MCATLVGFCGNGLKANRCSSAAVSEAMLEWLEGLSDEEAEALLAGDGLLMETGAEVPEVKGD